MLTSESIFYFPNPLPGDAKAETSIPASSAPSVRISAEPNIPVIASDIDLRNESDDRLLVQAGNGSKDALSILFQRHGRRVFIVSHRILKDEAESEDLVQEIFIQLFQKASQYDSGKGSAISWIIQMTYHRAFDRRKYLISRQHYKNVGLDEERSDDRRDQVSITKIAARTLLQRLRHELSIDQLRALELYLFEGYSFDEIADKTGHSIGNVRNHYYRGLKRLHSYVFPEGNSNESESTKRI
jgi:RNA polymerase sigma-70 factor, ECF subfamily